ncbi:MAG: sugar transferase [Solirubrobacterales bacterium]
MLAAADLLAGAIAAGVVAIPATGAAWALLLAPGWLLAAKLIGLYDRDHRALRHLTSDEIPSIFAWALAVTVSLELALTATEPGPLGPAAAIAHVAVAIAAAVTTRSMARWAWLRWTPPELVGMLGDEPTLGQMRKKFGLFRDMNFQLAAERRLDDLGERDERELELCRLVGGVDRVVVAAGGIEAELIARLSTLCREHQAKLSVVSPFRGRALPAPQVTQLADLPVLEYNTWDPSRSSLLLKRMVDLMVAVPSLVVLLPLYPLIALAIKADSRGPVIFSQVRAGLGGRPFRMYKLRTMRSGAEADLDRYVDLGGLAEPAFKLVDDPRVTRVGRILRRLSIDELPQLVNVAVGEMSLVGPRPEQVELVDRYRPEDRIRLTVKPGITGPMQIFGRGELSFSERMAVEIEYVENQSLARDLGIIIHTLPAVARGTGAS